LGPLFIAAALFPATRRFFENWVGQAVNCALLVALYAATCALQINFATSHVPTSLTLGAIIEQAVMGIAFVVISISLPNLAAALAGGAAISANAHSLKGPLGAALKALKSGGKGKGGSVSGS
jgi:type IV secretion system protein VirB6